MKIKVKILYLFLMAFLCFTVVGCTVGKDKINNIITNNVTNEVTNHITTYDDLKIDTIEKAIQTCVASVQDSVIGVTLKIVNTGKVGLTSFSHEDTEKVGSGVIYKAEENIVDGKLTGYIYYAYTNAHVVKGEQSNGTYKTYAFFGYDNISVEATVLGMDEKVDLACIKFNHTKYIRPVELGDSSTIEKGEFVVAIGNPEGYKYYGSTTFGIISNLTRFISFDTDNDGVNDFSGEYLQTDAAINPGNSGGGLFTLDGKLIGINSAKLTSTEIDNMGFAIPANIVKDVVNNYLEKGESITRPRLGVTCISIRDLTTDIMVKNGITSIPNCYLGEEPYGIYITSFAQSGSLVGTEVSKGDILLSFDGKKLYTMDSLSELINNYNLYPIGKTVEISYYSQKNDKIIDINIVLKSGN